MFLLPQYVNSSVKRETGIKNPVLPPQRYMSYIHKMPLCQNMGRRELYNL